MLAKPLSRVLIVALAGTVLAGTITLKQPASSRPPLNAEPNAAITPARTGEGQRCMGVNGQAANDPACIKPCRKIQERLIYSDDLPGNERATPLPPDQDLRSLSPTPAVKAADNATRPDTRPRLVPLRSLAGERWAD